jgi:hypothetical protein
LDEHPVVRVVAAAGGLPAVAHGRGQAGQQQVLGVAVEHVAAADDPGSVLRRGHVDDGRQQPRVGHHLAVHA